MDKIYIHGIAVQAHIGVTELERAQSQELLISLVLETDLSAAALSDDITESVDYDQVTDAVIAYVTTWRGSLLERLSEQLVYTLLNAFDIAVLTVTITKPHALTGRALAAAVEITRRK